MSFLLLPTDALRAGDAERYVRRPDRSRGTRRFALALFGLVLVASLGAVLAR